MPGVHKQKTVEDYPSTVFPSVPGEIRTPDRTLRRRMLYPAELLGHSMKFIWSG